MTEPGMIADLPRLSQVRRLEAVSFRAFPCGSTWYDGTWAVRLTAALPARRLNSVNPLDPSDHYELETRVERAHHHFSGFGRRAVFRLSPLAPVELVGLLARTGWRSEDRSVVMLLALEQLDFDNVLDQVPLRDTGLWVDAMLALTQKPADAKPGYCETIANTDPLTGLFLHSDGDGTPKAAARCVVDRDLAGIFDVVTAAAERGRGHGRAIVLNALKWARHHGATHAWLQVETENRPAVSLYHRLGFGDVYHYSYSALPDED